ncbi:MAG: succinylglutamate desuccinylase/aspartoacylase family protein [Chloroflexota bacterium]
MSTSASGSFPWPSIPGPDPGSIQRGWIPGFVPQPARDQPYIAVHGSGPGPAVLIRSDRGFAVTHGILRLADVLDGRRLHGSLLILPGALQGNRIPAGMLELLAPAGAVLDLETAPGWKPSVNHVWRHAPVAVGVDARGRDVAHALNLPYTLATDFTRWPPEWLWGADVSRALHCRVLIAEDRANRDEIAGRVMNDVVNALRVCGGLEGLPSPTETIDARLIGIARSPVHGLWIPEVEPGQTIEDDTRLGELRELTGELVGTMRATYTGVVLACSTAVQVREQDPLVWVIAPDRFVS